MSAIKAHELGRLRILREEFAQAYAARMRHRLASERAYEIAARSEAVHYWMDRDTRAHHSCGCNNAKGSF